MPAMCVPSRIGTPMVCADLARLRWGSTAMHADQFVSTWRRIRTRHVAAAVVVLLVAALLNVIVGEQKAKAAGSSCGANINPIVCENSQTTNVDGTALVPQDTWDIDGAGDS